MVDIDFTLLAALSSWALVAGTLLILFWQTRQAQRLNSANSVMALRERFDSPRMRRARQHLSSRLMKNAPEEVTSVEVAVFFELVGTLTHRKVLDHDLVWEAFGSWITNYYHALRNPVDLIGKARADLQDPLVFHEFEWLHDRMMALDRKALGVRHAAALEHDEERRAILQREAVLDTDVS
jgi:gamma-glutamylcysteine synthetase